ncbi:MAG TPA: hypothetical protein VLS87_06430 [Woeseiaceae bacterium]|nr:hypothetical protein [Woeseiaceae bacterium]
MKAKTAIATVFALVLAAAAVCGEQYRLQGEVVEDDGAAIQSVQVATNEVDVTN